jgi:hypothetical protein
MRHTEREERLVQSTFRGAMPWTMEERDTQESLAVLLTYLLALVVLVGQLLCGAVKILMGQTRVARLAR